MHCYKIFCVKGLRFILHYDQRDVKPQGSIFQAILVLTYLLMERMNPKPQKTLYRILSNDNLSSKICFSSFFFLHISLTFGLLNLAEVGYSRFKISCRYGWELKLGRIIKYPSLFLKLCLSIRRIRKHSRMVSY